MSVDAHVTQSMSSSDKSLEEPAVLAPSVAPPQAEEVATLVQCLTFQTLLRPLSDFNRSVTASQSIVSRDLAALENNLQSIQTKMARIESTFSKLPSYIGKLELLHKNSLILQDNATKTRQLAIKIATELGVDTPATTEAGP